MKKNSEFHRSAHMICAKLPSVFISVVCARELECVRGVNVFVDVLAELLDLRIVYMRLTLGASLVYEGRVTGVQSKWQLIRCDGRRRFEDAHSVSGRESAEIIYEQMK